jgi:DNA-binding NtrC family response regulator
MQNHATILVVENGDLLRPLLSKILIREGYKVLEAKDGAEALHLWDRYSGTIDVVVTDVVMPNMSGKQLVERLRLLKPDLKVIYMSGYASNVLAAGNNFGSNATFLQKPFRPVELSNTVREILGS